VDRSKGSALHHASTRGIARLHRRDLSLEGSRPSSSPTDRAQGKESAGPFFPYGGRPVAVSPGSTVRTIPTSEAAVGHRPREVSGPLSFW